MHFRFMDASCRPLATMVKTAANALTAGDCQTFDISNAFRRTGLKIDTNLAGTNFNTSSAWNWMVTSHNSSQ